MKNYSNFIKGKKEIKGIGFVTSYKVQDGEIQIYTPDTKKNNPLKYEATAESIDKIERRLEKQYNLLIDNQDEYLKETKKSIRKLIYSLGIAFLSAALIPSLTIEDLSVLGNTLIELGRITGITAIAGGEIGLAFYGEAFKIRMSTYKEYINKRHMLEAKARQDKNITSHLEASTFDLIREKEELRKSELIEDVFNIDFMDKVSLKELKEMLLRYRISEKLDEEQVFCVPNTCYIAEKGSKTRKRVQ